MIILSGDVHYANRYQTPCEALTGYTLPEFTSSGMTHTCRTWMDLWIPGTLRWHQDPLYTTEDIMAEYNFGDILIDTKNNEVTVSIKDVQNNDFLNKTFDLTKDKIYNPNACTKN